MKTYHTFNGIGKVNPKTRTWSYPKQLQVFESDNDVDLKPVDKAPDGAKIEYHDVPITYR